MLQSRPSRQPAGSPEGRLGRPRRTHLAPWLVVSVLAASLNLVDERAAWGQSSTPTETADEIAPAERSDQLSKSRYSSRQQATLDMWRRRDVTRDEVQQAARHPDPEVAGRANWILRQWRRGALPGIAPEVSQRLLQSDDPTAIASLLEAGEFPAAVVAVEEAVGTIDRQSIQRRMTTVITRRFPVYIKSAIERRSLPSLLRLIDLSADSKEMAVCRVQLMQQLGLEIDRSNLLPTSAEGWSEHQRRHATALVLSVLGRADEAVDVARDSGDQRLLTVCRMLAGHWNEMASECAELAKSADEGSYDQARFWSETLIASDRCDDQELFDQAVKALSNMDSRGNQLAVELRWKSLAGHGQIDAALDLLAQSRPDAAAAVAIASARGRRAFELLGLKREHLDEGQRLETWIDDALASQGEQEKPTTEVRCALTMIRVLLSIGRKDAAWRVATRICDSHVQVDEIPIREYVLATLTMTQRRDWVLKLAQAAGSEQFSPITQNTLAGTIRGADRASFETLMIAIEALKPRLGFEDRVQIVYQLLSGKPAKGFDPATDFKLLFDQLATGKRQIQQQRGLAVVRHRVRISLPIAHMFAANGRADLATQCLRYLVENRSVEATLESAQRELDGGRNESASEWLDAVWSRVEGNGQPSRYRNSSDSVDLAAKALVGQWTIARRTGDRDRQDALERQIRLTLCTPSTETRSELAGYLGDRDETELALEVYQTLLPMTAFGTPGANTLYQVAWKYSRLAKQADIDSAARWYDLAASGTLESTDYYRSDYYVTLPVDVKRWYLEAAIRRGDRVVAEKSLERILQLDPLDVDAAERLVPEMRDAGMTKLADDALTRILDRGVKHSREFPLDATSCNNLAWVAAMNEKELDLALPLAERAVFLEPDSAIYRDTLAEVLFQLGRKKEALEIEEHCILDDPGQWHLHEQVKKYREALEESTD